MCNCAKIRSDLSLAVRRGAVVDAASIAAAGATEFAAQTRAKLKSAAPAVVRIIRTSRSR